MARLEELERKFEENPRRYFAPLANEYRKAGDAQRAVELCRAQLPEVPGHISGHIVLGQALYDARDFDGSRAALETALALDPENIVALRYLGDIARDTGDISEAERWYSRTLEADPYNEAATAALQTLRATPAAAPAIASPPSEPEAQPATEAFAAGFEPTSHVEPELPAPSLPEPELSEPAEIRLPVEHTPSAGIADAGPAHGAPETVSAVPEQEEPVLAVPAGQSVEPTMAPTEPAEEPTSVEELATPVEEPAAPLEEAAPESLVASEAAPQAALEMEPAASGVRTATGEFAGDLSVSTAQETAEPVIDETSVEPEPQALATDELSDAPATTESSIEAPSAVELTESPSEDSAEVSAPPEASPEEPFVASATMEPPTAEPIPAPEPVELAPEPPAVTAPEAERFDEAAHAPTAPETPEEAMQAEERVLESAAPFVTETMADLYLEQGYPHEALELLLQLSEQRPQDEQLRGKIEQIESMIVARRDAAVAAARAERADAAEAATGTETTDVVVEAMPEPGPEPEAEPEPEPEPESTISVRELFARMDRARPRAASSVTPRPISRRRSDFVPLPDGEPAASEAADDPFAFPNPPAPSPVPRTSGPHQTFNPSTADADDFNAWLRGLRGP